MTGAGVQNLTAWALFRGFDAAASLKEMKWGLELISGGLFRGFDAAASLKGDDDLRGRERGALSSAALMPRPH